MAEARTVWFLFHVGCHWSVVSLSALSVSPLIQTIAPLWGLDSCFTSPTCQAGPVLLTLLFCPPVPSSYRVLHSSINSFPLVSTPVCSQRMFCMHFCVWRYSPDVSMERNVLHIHLLLCHRVPPLSDFLITAFLADVKYYLIVVLNCIFLIADGSVVF